MARVLKITAIAAAAMLALSGCASGNGNGDGGGGTDTVIYRIQADPVSMIPAMTTGYPDQQVGSVIFEGLTMPDKDGLAAPALAESWDISDDGLEYTFHLRDDVKWHDGEPFTSADVKFTYEKVSLPYGPVWGRIKGNFQGVDTPDEHTAVLKLKTPYAPILLLTRTSHNGAILPEHVYKDVDMATVNAVDVPPIGTGSFKFDHYTPGQEIALVRNDDYWGGTPKIAKLIAQVIPENRSAMSAMQAGELDFMPQLGGNQIAELEQIGGFTVADTLGGNPAADYLFFNVERPIVSEPAVRRALVQAIDRDYLLEKVYFGDGEPGVSAILDKWANSGVVDYTKDLPFNIEAAGKALDAAGHPADASGKRFALKFVTVADPPELEQLALAIKSMWAQVGVDVEVVKMERAAFLEATSTGTDYDLTSQQLTSFGDPAAGTARVYVCSSIGTQFANSSRYCNSELDKVWEAAAAATDVGERRDLYAKIDTALLADMPSMVIRQYVGKYAIRSDLKVDVVQGAIGWAEARFE